MAEFLLQNGADVNAQDKGGLIPMHNASSYGVSSLPISLLLNFRIEDVVCRASGSTWTHRLAYFITFQFDIFRYRCLHSTFLCWYQLILAAKFPILSNFGLDNYETDVSFNTYQYFLLVICQCPFVKWHFLILFQHVDIAALLIKYNTCVNVVDKWGFTPLHEAAQKGRTQLCALLVSLCVHFYRVIGLLL